MYELSQLGCNPPVEYGLREQVLPLLLNLNGCYRYCRSQDEDPDGGACRELEHGHAVFDLKHSPHLGNIIEPVIFIKVRLC